MLCEIRRTSGSVVHMNGISNDNNAIYLALVSAFRQQYTVVCNIIGRCLAASKYLYMYE